MQRPRFRRPTSTSGPYGTPVEKFAARERALRNLRSCAATRNTADILQHRVVGPPQPANYHRSANLWKRPMKVHEPDVPVPFVTEPTRGLTIARPALSSPEKASS